MRLWMHAGSFCCVFPRLSALPRLAADLVLVRSRRIQLFHWNRAWRGPMAGVDHGAGAVWFLLSALKVKVKKFNVVRVYVVFVWFIHTSSMVLPRFIQDASGKISCKEPQLFSLLPLEFTNDTFLSVQYVPNVAVWHVHNLISLHYRATVLLLCCLFEQKLALPWYILSTNLDNLAKLSLCLCFYMSPRRTFAVSPLCTSVIAWWLLIYILACAIWQKCVKNGGAASLADAQKRQTWRAHVTHCFECFWRLIFDDLSSKADMS